MLRTPLFVFIAVATIVAIGCQPDKPKATLDNVNGTWTVVAATRNERPTQLLNGTFFAFDTNGAVRSNLPLTETAGDWTAAFNFTNDSTLRFGTPPLDYTLKSWSDSTLELEFTTRGLPFRLQLQRSAALTPQTAPISSDSIE